MDIRHPLDDRMPALLKSGQRLRGIFNGLPSPAIVEMCAYAGFDFVVIDNEHGSADLETTENMLRAARASGIPQDDGFVKNRYVARTFIQPGQELRKHGLRLKFNPLPDVVRGQRLVVVDDSIVRGNTTRQIVQMLRDAGAQEVHLRISAPPIRNPCHYGVDMSTREEMIAHKRTVQEIADELDADSLAYLSLDGVYEAIGTAPEDHCDACFSGRYPLGDPEEANGKFALEDAAVVPASR